MQLRLHLATFRKIRNDRGCSHLATHPTKGKPDMYDVNYYMSKVQGKAIDVAALAESGCDAGTLSLAVGDLRDAVTELAAEARATRRGVER